MIRLPVIRASVLRRLAAALALPALLAGCAGDDDPFVLTCPQALIVEDASRLAIHAPGAGRDLLDLRFRASIDALDWTCEFFPDEKRVDVELRAALRVLRGPAAQGAPAVRLPVFVAVADPQGDLVARRGFELEIGFPGQAVEVGHLWHSAQRLRYGALSEAADYTIYVGYRLTREQLAAARAAGGP